MFKENYGLYILMAVLFASYIALLFAALYWAIP